MCACVRESLYNQEQTSAELKKESKYQLYRKGKKESRLAVKHKLNLNQQCQAVVKTANILVDMKK